MNTVMRMLQAHQIGPINSYIDLYVECQKTELQAMYAATKELLVEMNICTETREFLTF